MILMVVSIKQETVNFESCSVRWLWALEWKCFNIAHTTAFKYTHESFVLNLWLKFVQKYSTYA